MIEHSIRERTNHDVFQIMTFRLVFLAQLHEQSSGYDTIKKTLLFPDVSETHILHSSLVGVLATILLLCWAERSESSYKSSPPAEEKNARSRVYLSTIQTSILVSNSCLLSLPLANLLLLLLPIHHHQHILLTRYLARQDPRMRYQYPCKSMEIRRKSQL